MSSDHRCPVKAREDAEQKQLDAQRRAENDAKERQEKRESRISDLKNWFGFFTVIAIIIILLRACFMSMVR